MRAAMILLALALVLSASATPPTVEVAPGPELDSAATSSSEIDDFDAYIADIQILQDKNVQAELGITEGQRTAMNKHADWFNGETHSIGSQVNSGKLKPEEANTKMGSLLVTMKHRIIGELTAAQLKRLREITLQRDGLLPLLDKKVGEKIGLTEGQRKKLVTAYAENDEKARNLQKTAMQPIADKYAAMKPKDKAEETKLTDQMNKEMAAAAAKIQPDLEKLAKTFSDLVDATLSKGQKDDFTALKGKPFVPKKAGS
jgi:hypothetical protein